MSELINIDWSSAGLLFMHIILFIVAMVTGIHALVAIVGFLEGEELGPRCLSQLWIGAAWALVCGAAAALLFGGLP